MYFIIIFSFMINIYSDEFSQTKYISVSNMQVMKQNITHT